MSDIITIRAKIKSLLDTLVDSDINNNNTLSFVDDIHRIGLDSYPALTFEFVSEEGEFSTNVENERTQTRDMVVRSNYSGDSIDREEALVAHISIYQQIKELFDVNRSLDGIVQWSLPINSEISTIETDNGFEMINRITLLTKTIEDA